MRTICLWVSLVIFFSALPAWAGEKGTARGTAKSERSITQVTAPVEDVAGHQLLLWSGQEKVKSPDHIGEVPVNEATILFAEIDDFIKGSGKIHKGYQTWETVSGDKAFATYVADVIAPTGEKPGSFIGSFEWTGGTGKLRGLKGKGKMAGRINADWTYTYEWTGEWEFP